MKINFLEKSHPNSRLSKDDGYHKTRWVFEISNKKRWRCLFYIGREYTTASVEWRPCGDYYSFFIRNEFKFERDSAYYDGAHNWLSLGYLKFAWSGKYNEKCEK